MSECGAFSGVSDGQANEILREASGPWFHGDFPEARSIGDVARMMGLIRIAEAEDPALVIVAEDGNNLTEEL